MDSLYKQANKRLLTTTNPYNYTNVSLKSLQIYKTDPRSGNNVNMVQWFAAFGSH